MKLNIMSKLNALCNVIRKQDNTFPVNHLQILLYIAENEGCINNDISNYMDCAANTITRAIDALGTRQAYNKDGAVITKGMALVERRQESVDARLKQLYLTKKGKTFISKLQEVING